MATGGNAAAADGAADYFRRNVRVSGTTRTAVLWFIAFEVAYYIAYRYGMSFSQALPSPFWFPDSVLLCALLKARPRHWWIFVAGALPIRLLSFSYDLPLWFLLGTIIVDFARSLFAAALLRQFMSNPTRFDTIRDLIVFAAVAVVAAPALSAFGGAALRSMRGYDYWQCWESWFLGDALAQIVITPAIFYWVFDTSWYRKRYSTSQMLEMAGVFAGLVLTSFLATHVRVSSIYFTETAFYAPIPFLFWAAIRFGMPGATGGVIILVCFAVEAALQGRGPFAGHAPADISFALQNFLLLRSAPLYLVAVAIAQERTAERSLRESEERFRKLAEHAEEDHRALAHAQRLAVMGELTATIAHELRQPLNAVTLNADTARRIVTGENAPELREILTDIRESALRADGVISRVRGFLGKPGSRMQAIAPNEVIQDVLILVGRDASKRGVEISTDFGEDLPLVAAEPIQLQQVLVNLIVNGMEAMDSMTDRVRRLKLGTKLSTNGDVEFSVSDSGVGIQPEQMGLLFNSFWSTRPSGMGLGLSIARTIVETHRGRIWAENNPEGGATFRFVLPAADRRS